MRKYICIFLSSCLLAVGFFIFYVGEILVLIGFIPLFWCLLKENWTYKKSFLYFFSSGIFFFGINFSWMFSLLPLEWAGIESLWLAYILFFLIWFIVLCLFAFWWGVFGAGVRYFLYKISLHKYILLSIFISVFWVLCEYMRSFMVSFFAFSQTYSSIFSEWTFGSLVYAMTDGWVVLLVSLGGIYLVNFVIMFCNVFVFLNLYKSNTIKKGILNGATFLFGVISISTFCGFLVLKWHEYIYSFEHFNNVAVMRTDIPRAFSYSKNSKSAPIQEAVNSVISLPEKIDILVSPEDVDVLSFDAQNSGRLIDRMKKDNTTLINHEYVRQESGLISRTVYWRGDVGIIGFQGKSILMPIGEYLPSVIKNTFKFFGYKQATDVYEKARSVTVSEKALPVVDTKGVFGSVVCSEVSNPNIISSLVKNGANIIFLQTSDTLFQKNYLYEKYMIAMARVRAMEVGRFVIRASNAGPTVIIDSIGRLQVRKDIGNGVIIGKVPNLNISTPYLWLHSLDI